jgi:hypothetical protein
MYIENDKTELLNLSSIENVDFAFFDWLDRDLNLSCETKDGFKKLPIFWVTPERAYQVKVNKEFRDTNGALKPPMMTVERTSIEKDQKNSATFFANIPQKNNKFIVSKRINQKKTSEFANADFKRKYGEVGFLSPTKNKKVVYEYKEMLLPVYAYFTYNINIFTQYQQQMNEILQPFITKFGSQRYFLIQRDGYKYECFLQANIETKNNVGSMEEEERKYISSLTVKVLANLVSDGVNQKDSVFKTFENPVEIKLPKDNIIVSPPIIEDQKKKNLLLPSEFEGSRIPIKITKIFGNLTDVTYTIPHNLNSRDLYVSVRENFGDYAKVEVAIGYQDLNSIEIDLGFPAESEDKRFVVTIIG